MWATIKMVVNQVFKTLLEMIIGTLKVKRKPIFYLPPSPKKTPKEINLEMTDISVLFI